MRYILMALMVLAPAVGASQEKGTQVYLTVEEAPRVVFPEAEAWDRKDLRLTPTQSQEARRLVEPARPTIWEPFYISFIARKDQKVIGYAVICEEIGKHRPITFIVAVTPEGQVRDVAIMMYREPQGSEVRHRGFLSQFGGKDLSEPIRQHRDIHNISGATLSVQALSRGVRKALAVIRVAYLNPQP